MLCYVYATNCATLSLPFKYGARAGCAAQVREELALPDSAQTPFKGLQLGTMIGKGGYGRVYRGMYEGQLVAVKVRSLARTTHCMAHVMHALSSCSVAAAAILGWTEKGVSSVAQLQAALQQCWRATEACALADACKESKLLLCAFGR